MEIENAWFRPAVCYLVEVRGMSMKVVADMFGVYHQAVSHAIKRYNETGKHEDRKGRGRKRMLRDEANIEEARNQLRQNNQTKRRNGVAGNSTRKLGRKLGISRESARRILKKI